MARGRYPVSEFDSKITSKVVIKGRVTCLLTLFVWYVFKTKERGTERLAAVPKGGGGVLSMMAYTGRPCSKGVRDPTR